MPQKINLRALPETRNLLGVVAIEKQLGQTGSDVPRLEASGYVEEGDNHIDLSWNIIVTDVNVYRDDVLVATVSGNAYTDDTGENGTATRIHKVCAAGTCSNETTTMF